MNHRMVIILVLYKKRIAECPAYNVLKEAIRKNNSLHLFVYDNSPSRQTDDLFEFDRVSYSHDKENPGLAKAYNAGFSYYLQVKAQLLMLLDQDTLIQASDIEQVMTYTDIAEVGACVPIVYSGEQRISPVFSRAYISRERSYPDVGITAEAVMAINSGTVLTETGLQAVGKFNEAFPLDFLDHWIFWTLHQKNMNIAVLPFSISHDLSVLDYSKVSLLRYESIVSAETRFYTQYDRNKLLIHRRHLLKRLLKQFLIVKNRRIWRRTWEEYQLLKRDKR